MDKKFTRRQLLASGAGMYFALEGAGAITAFGATLDQREISPVRAFSGDFASSKFDGDDLARGHAALRDPESYIQQKGGRPAQFRSEKVVVIGGGISGLLSGYFLRDHQPLVLEQATRFGGNCKAERYHGTTFSKGAAYIARPDPGSAVHKFLHATGLNKYYRQESAAEVKVLFAGHGLRKLWKGETDPEARTAIARVVSELARINKEAYPEIPYVAGEGLSFSAYRELDEQTAEQWLESKFAGLHPHVKEYFQLYSWGSFGGSLSEVSAAQFVNFVAAESAGILAFPGGNAAIAEALFQLLRKKLGAQKMQAGSMVIEIKNLVKGVEILYEDVSGKLQRVQAKAAVVTMPKFIAKHVLKGLEPQRTAAWSELTYRSYVVVNVLLRRKAAGGEFDLYCLQGQMPPPPTAAKPPARPWTDIGYADWANHGRGSATVLTIYKPYPFDGARPLLMQDSSSAALKTEIEEALPRHLALLGLAGNTVEGIRFTRIGHALPLARPGMLTGEHSKWLRAPFQRIAFANQDGYASPCFESSFDTAARAAALVHHWVG